MGFYIYLQDIYKRTGSIAATNKMYYIASSISRGNKPVEILSPSWYVDRDTHMAKANKIKLGEYLTLIQVPSFSTSIKSINYIRIVIAKVWILFYILKNIKKGENIIVYHSLGLIDIIKIAKKIKGFNLVLEVNEVYTDVHKYSDKVIKKEKKFLESADKYIFCTELLNKKINKSNKPYIINYGTYKVEPYKNKYFNDKRIHIVYAGTFDLVKGGATTAIKIAEYLDEKYHIHIIGFGTQKETCHIHEMINNISGKTKCKITYDGMLDGEKYIDFLQRCDIGLSTQTPSGAYNETSFPSKVLSYMANGLRVVSIRLKVLEESRVNDLLYYYNNDEPKEIAELILSINLEVPYNSRTKIAELDRIFEKEIKELVEI